MLQKSKELIFTAAIRPAAPPTPAQGIPRPGGPPSVFPWPPISISKLPVVKSWLVKPGSRTTPAASGRESDLHGSSQAAASVVFSRQLGRLMVLPLSHPAMIITWAVLAVDGAHRLDQRAVGILDGIPVDVQHHLLID